MGHGEGAKCARTLGMHTTLGNDLTAKVSQFLKEPHVLEQHRAAVKAYPTSRLLPSVKRLDLDKEIRCLRDKGGWLPWDHKTSDAALNRVRPHFAASARSPSGRRRLSSGTQKSGAIPAIIPVKLDEATPMTVKL